MDPRELSELLETLRENNVAAARFSKDGQLTAVQFHSTEPEEETAWTGEPVATMMELD